MFCPSQHRLHGLRTVRVENVGARPSTNIRDLVFTVSEMTQPRMITVVKFSYDYGP